MKGVGSAVLTQVPGGGERGFELVGDSVQVDEVGCEAFGDDAAVAMRGEQPVEGARIGVDRGDEVATARPAEVCMLEKFGSRGLRCIARRDDQAEKQQTGRREGACRESSVHGY